MEFSSPLHPFAVVNGAQENPPSHVDDFSGHPRVVVISEIGNEPDDQMSLTRLLLTSSTTECIRGSPDTAWQQPDPDRMSEGASAIIKAAGRDDKRPMWISIWGGANTLAQALLHVRATRPAEAMNRFVAKLRVYSISDQDDAGPWIRREFPHLFYIVAPSTPLTASIITPPGPASVARSITGTARVRTRPP